MINSSENSTNKYKVIGSNLRFLREACNFSQTYIGNVLGVSYQQIQKYETGQNRFPIEKLYQLKVFYDVPFEVFFRGLDKTSLTKETTEQREEMILYSQIARLQDQALKQKIKRIIMILLS